MLDQIIRQLQQQRAQIDAALKALTGGAAPARRATTKRRTLSVAARRRIAAAQRARWAKWRAGKK